VSDYTDNAYYFMNSNPSNPCWTGPRTSGGLVDTASYFGTPEYGNDFRSFGPYEGGIARVSGYSYNPMSLY